MDRDQWSTLISAAGSVSAAVGLVYAVGVEVLSLRYAGFGLSGQQAVTVAPREQVLIRGSVAILVWTALGVLLVLVLDRVPDRAAWAASKRLRGAGLAGVAGVALALLMVLHVWWPLLAFGAVVTIFLASEHWRRRPVRRFLACALAVGVVAVAYEADRLRFIVERSCVETSEPAGRRCGILVGQTERGAYLGVIPADGRATELLFVPAARIRTMSTVKVAARVIPSIAHDRREPLRTRVLGLDIR